MSIIILAIVLVFIIGSVLACAFMHGARRRTGRLGTNPAHPTEGARPLILTTRPIDTWPRPETASRGYSPFKATYRSTLTLLDRELSMLNARQVVLQIDVREEDLRLDGQLRANARAQGPRVALAFDSKHGPLRYYCDRWNDWQANLRGIALGLEAQRKLERYGITSRGEQYTGWKALGTGLAMGAGMTPAAAAQMLADLACDAAGDGWEPDDIRCDPAMREAAYRALAKTHHPDVGGDPALFARITDARNVLASAA